MVNKPKFNIFKNISYALQGAVTVLKSETSFKTQLLVIAIIGFTLLFIDISTISKLVLFFSTWLILIAEAFNSAIERVVDLVTQDYHQLAKEAKDIGSFGVLLTFIFIAIIWGLTLYLEFSWLYYWFNDRVELQGDIFTFKLKILKSKFSKQTLNYRKCSLISSYDLLPNYSRSQ